MKKALKDREKRMLFKLFWAKEKTKYKKHKFLEEVLWAYLKSINHDEPENFVTGLERFGIKKVK